MSETPLTGGCNCGAVRFEVTAPLLGASYCHCRRCQHGAGLSSRDGWCRWERHGDVRSGVGRAGPELGAADAARCERPVQQHANRFRYHGQRGDGRYSAQAAAKLLNVTVSTIADWCKAGKLDGVQVAPHGPWWVKLTPELRAALRKPRRQYKPRRAHAPSATVQGSATQQARHGSCPPAS